MMLPLWAWITLAGAVAQTGRNATQSGLTARLGTLGATNTRFLFGLPFACLFLALAVWFTGETPPDLTLMPSSGRWPGHWRRSLPPR